MTELKNIYTDKYTFLVGDYSPVDNEKLSDEGFTVILERPHIRTHERFDSLDDALDVIARHEDNYDEQCKIDDGIADYLASPEGAWGRSGT